MNAHGGASIIDSKIPTTLCTDILRASLDYHSVRRFGRQDTYNIVKVSEGGMVFRLFKVDSAKLPKQPLPGRRPDY